MTPKSDTKNAFLNNVNERSDELERISQDILSHPESGYKEQRTSELVSNWFRTAGFEVQTGIGL
ncbi:MAG: hypothetical protein VW271_08505, partial [Chloroflexota bacterium]